MLRCNGKQFGDRVVESVADALVKKLSTSAGMIQQVIARRDDMPPPIAADLRWPGSGAARLAGLGGTDRRTDRGVA